MRKFRIHFVLIYVARVQGGAGGLDAGDGQDGNAQPDGVRRVARDGHAAGLGPRAGAARTPAAQLPHAGHAVQCSQAVRVPFQCNGLVVGTHSHLM